MENLVFTSSQPHSPTTPAFLRTSLSEVFGCVSKAKWYFDQLDQRKRHLGCKIDLSNTIAWNESTTALRRILRQHVSEPVYISI